MKYLLLTLFLALPFFSFASVVPSILPVQYTSSGFWDFQPISPSSDLFDYVCGSQLCFPSPTTSYAYSIYASSSPYLTDDWSLSPLGTCASGVGGTPVSLRFSSTTISSCSSSFPTQDNIFINVYMTGASTSSSILLGYGKWRFNGTNWVDSLGSGASGSWDFSTSTNLLPVDFSDFAQGLKDAIANNTKQPVCTFSDLLSAGFWSECVATAVFNWLFVPSSSAIDYMIEQMTNTNQYGSSFAYMLIMPVASSVSVTACDLDDVPSCSVGAPLTIPILDVHGSSTPWVLDPVSPVPSYFDDFLSSIVAVIILAGVSRVVLHKFL